MRASRVTNVGMPIQRQYKRIEESAERFSMMSDQGSLEQFTHERQKKQKKKRVPIHNGNVQSKKEHVLIKGIIFKPENVMYIRNALRETSMQVNYTSRRVVLHRTYKDSI